MSEQSSLKELIGAQKDDDTSNTLKEGEKKTTTDVVNEKYGHRVLEPRATEFDSDSKYCPGCCTESPKSEEFNTFYTCPNDNCGILDFKTGFYEWVSYGWDDDWLHSIDWSVLSTK